MVNNPTQRDIPAFYSPLTHDQHAQIGRIAILWGQIDMFVDGILTHVLGISAELRRELFSERQIGSKLDVLKSFCLKISDHDGKKEVQKFIEIVYQSKAMRNRCFHGTWGYRVLKSKKVIAAAQHYKQQENPFKASDLPMLERKLCQASHQGMIAIATVSPTEYVEGAHPLFHGAEAESFPKWFAQWREQHYADHRTLDHNWKPGRLPYLKQPPQ